MLILHSSSLRGFPSGEQRVAEFEAAGLKELGVEVCLCIFGPEPAVGFRKYWTIFYSIFSNLWSWKAYRYLVREIKEFRPDVIHVHGLTPFLSVAVLKAASQCSVSVVQTLHNGRWVCAEGGFYRNNKYCDDCVGTSGWLGIMRGCKRGVIISAFFVAATQMGRSSGRIFKWVDRFIAVSNFIKEQHIRSGFPGHKITVKVNGVDVEVLKSLDGENKNREGIAVVGRVSIAKGVNIIKDLAHSLNCTINVVGDGPDLPEFKIYCKKLGFSHVKFWGNQPQFNCYQVMKNSICTIVPSQCGESYSLVAVESMGLGTPVIGSNLGGLGPLLTYSGGGIAVEYDDPSGFIKAAKKFIGNLEASREYGEIGKKYVRQKLAQNNNIPQLIEIYESVLQEKMGIYTAERNKIDVANL